MAAANVWKERHKRGILIVHPHQLSAPEADIMSRSLDEKWVLKLIRSFATTDDYNEDIMIVIRDAALFLKAKLEPEDLDGKKLEVFAGWHSATALQHLAHTYPDGSQLRLRFSFVKMMMKRELI